MNDRRVHSELSVTLDREDLDLKVGDCSYNSGWRISMLYHNSFTACHMEFMCASCRSSKLYAIIKIVSIYHA